jgi:hypothetical protein
MSKSVPSMPVSERRRAAESNYKLARLYLQNALTKEATCRLQQVAFPSFNDTPDVKERAAELEKTLEALIVPQNTTNDAKDRTKTAKEIIRSWFRASYPFAQFLLKAAVQGVSAVRSVASMLIF